MKIRSLQSCDNLPDRIYRYRPARRLVQELSTDNNFIWFAQFTDLNDPMEGIYNIDQSSNAEDFSNFRETIFYNKLSFGIACFSERYDILPMWAHYAENGTGYCVEYKTRELLDQLFQRHEVMFAGRINYVENLYSLNIDRDSHEAWPEHQTAAVKILSNKYKNWGYEEEIRIILNLQEYYANSERNLVTLENSAINRIILGIKFDRKRGFSFISNSSLDPKLNKSKDVYQLKRNGSSIDIVHSPLF